MTWEPPALQNNALTIRPLSSIYKHKLQVKESIEKKINDKLSGKSLDDLSSICHELRVRGLIAFSEL